MLGIREPGIYGNSTYEDLLKLCSDHCQKVGVEVEFYQSNHEGDLVDRIQACFKNTDGIVINPGAYTHTSVAILDALKAVGIPTVEVHISNVNEREPFRRISYVSYYAQKQIAGHGLGGYTEAIDYLTENKK